MTENIPALPTDPMLKVFVILSSLGWLAFAFSALQGWRNRSREQRIWGVAPVLFALATFVAARAGVPTSRRRNDRAGALRGELHIMFR